jgi:Lipocalin-like domain
MLRAAVTGAVLLISAAHAADAQQTDAAAGLVSSWLLVAAERDIASGQARRVAGARGLLVLDGAGNVFEFFTAPSGDRPASAPPDPRRAFADNGGFWGRYEAVAAAGRIDFEAEEGVSPNVRGLEFSRSYELAGDRLIITSTDEPQAQRDVRLTWQRVPTVEHLSPAYREVVGFWRHIDERRVNTATGEVETTRQRAPSVIVYTPGGFVGVHFPTLGRSPFAGETPTEEEAQAARNYLGYYGALGVYPGEVFHNVLGGVSPSAGAILRRFAKITGDELVVTIPSGNPQSTLATTVHLQRLSGADDMLPRAR